MSIRMICAVLTVLCVAPAIAWQRSAEPTGVSAAQAELIDINVKIEAAVLAHNTRYLEEIAASDFLFTHGAASAAGSGRPLVDTKATWVAAAKNARTPFLARDVTVQQVELHDDVALVAGEIHVRSASTDVTLQNYTISFIRVFARRNAGWKLLSHRTVRTSR